MKKYYNFLFAILLVINVGYTYGNKLSINTNTNPITADVVILSTTDLHGYMLNYNYFQSEKSNTVGLNRLATIIKQYRSNYNNILLLDNGDLIQGSALAEYIINNTDLNKTTHPIISGLTYLQYDVLNLGNHEFNYGLETLQNIINNSKIPVINYNVYNNNNTHKYVDHIIINKNIVASNNSSYNVKFGIIGLVPPKILQWDKAHLNNKVIAKDMVQQAKLAVKELEGKVDFIIILAHSGISNDIKESENVLTQIAKIPNVNYIVGGHTHVKFPDNKNKFFSGIAGVDAEKGTVYNVPTVVAGFHGSVLGVIKSNIQLINNKWTAVNNTVMVEESNIEDKEFNKIFANLHKETVNFLKKPIATINTNADNYFALVNDNYTIELVNKAQIAYIKQLQQTTLSSYANLPVLSAHGAFKNGGRMGSDYYTIIKKGNITFSNANDLYVYPNTLYILKISGKELKEYLEWTAQIYNTINVKLTTEQELINPAIPSYLYDVVDGVNYSINVTVNSRYKGLELINKNNNRIENLRYANGNLVKDNDEFLIATNNYRADTNNILNKNGKNVILDTAIENKTVVINYVREQQKLINMVDNNWVLDVKEAKNVIFISSIKGKNNSPANIKFIGEYEKGFAKYLIVNNTK